MKRLPFFILAGLLSGWATSPTAIAQAAPAPVAPAAKAPAPAVFSNASPILFREGGAGLPPYPVVVREETPPAKAARMKWFHDARFGIFIHWGVYAVPAKGEWYMSNAKVPQATYRAFAKDFTAAKYDPQAWAALFEEAGAKYMVITAKHHDGFTLYDSKVSVWNAVKAAAAHRDLLQPLADAVRARGIKFGLYYSQSQDWNNPGGGTGNRAPWDEEQKKGSFDDYLTKIAVPGARAVGKISSFLPLLGHRVFDDTGTHPAVLRPDVRVSRTHR